MGVVNWESVVEVAKDLLGMNAQSPVATIAIAIVFMVGSLWLGYWISKRTAKSRQVSSDHLEG